jgi:hypothetical protein
LRERRKPTFLSTDIEERRKEEAIRCSASNDWKTGGRGIQTTTHEDDDGTTKERTRDGRKTKERERVEYQDGYEERRKGNKED